MNDTVLEELCNGLVEIKLDETLELSFGQLAATEHAYRKQPDQPQGVMAQVQRAVGLANSLTGRPIAWLDDPRLAEPTLIWIASRDGLEITPRMSIDLARAAARPFSCTKPALLMVAYEAVSWEDMLSISNMKLLNK